MTTDPIVESVWVIPGADGTGQVQSSEARDEVWMIVKRTINGSTKRYVEVLERDFEHGHDQEDAYYADSLITYDQPLTVTGLSVAAAAAAYTTGAVHFDGSTIVSTASLAATDGGAFSYSFWFKLSAYDIGIVLADPTGQGNGDLLASDKSYTVGLTNSAFTSFYTAAIASGNVTPDVWHNILVSVNTNLGPGAKISHLYLDDTIVGSVVSDGDSAFTMSFNGLGFKVGTGFANFVGDLADFWFEPGTLIDFSIEANRRKFISAALKPVDLGADGSTPTGTAPAIFQRRASAAAASTFANNLGTGGAFTVSTGTLTDASTSPSD